MAVAIIHVPLALAAVLLVTAVCVDACSPPMGDGDRELSLPEMVQASDTVIYGKVRRTYPDPRFDYGSGISSVYTAEMTVFCVIRGRRTKARINVTEAGKPDQFPSLVVCGRNRGASAMLSVATARSRNLRVGAVALSMQLHPCQLEMSMLNNSVTLCVIITHSP